MVNMSNIIYYYFRHHLNKEYMIDGEKSLVQAQIVGVVHDVSNHWTRESLDPKILRLIYLHSNKHFILILNKVIFNY